MARPRRFPLTMAVAVLLALLLGAGVTVLAEQQLGGGNPTPSPVPTATRTAVVVAAATQTPSPVPTRTPAPTPEPTATPRPTAVPLPTVTPKPPAPTVPPTAPPAARFTEVARGNPASALVALTFDAGADGAPLQKILDALRQHGVKATFFMTGGFAEKYPELVKQIVREGHELGNHTYSHPDLTRASDQEIISELTRTEALVQRLTGVSTKPWFRPPFGARNAHVLNVVGDQGYRSIYWTLDSLDSVGETKTPAFLVERVTNPRDGAGKPIPLQGAIILMHVGSEPSAEALPEILDRLQALKLRQATISELLEH